VTSYDYDAQGVARLTHLGAKRDGVVITDFSYSHDAAGNRIQKKTPQLQEDYAYDRLDRLVEATRPGQGRRFGYDSVGNRTREELGGNVLTSSYNARNQLEATSAGGQTTVAGTLDESGSVAVNGQPTTALAGNRFEGQVSVSAGTNTFTVKATDPSGNMAASTYRLEVSGAGTSFEYDANGNLTRKTGEGHVWTYAWDAENHLTHVLRDGAEVARFAYDPLGRRVEKVAAGVTARYLYDNEDVLREFRTGAATATYTYVHGPGADEPLARIDSTLNWEYYHADGLGSVVATTSHAGVVVSARQYDAWGNIEAGSNEPGFAFTGREWDPEIALYYYRARYYDPKAGSFISEDPARDGMAFYAYAGGNPIRNVDPMGLEFGDYWDITATIHYYDNVPVSSPWVGFARIGSFMLSTFGMENAQKAGAAAGQGNYRCAAAQGTLSLFKGLTLASPLLARSAAAAPAGPALLGEARTFGTVSRNYWKMMGGAHHVGTDWALDHMFIARAAGGPNTWWNLAAIPRGLNSYMNGAPATMWARYMVNGGVLGSLGGGAVAGAWAGLTECGCGN
jgi:RHS repeat-associated protein